MELLKRFESYLQSHPIKIESFHPHYQEALNYMIGAGGKRFRPLLLLSVVEAKNPLMLDSAMDAALAIEIFHTYSLIHDDLPVMDDADLRRGKETLHKKFTEVTAVLVGDALNTHAFYLLCNAALSSDTKSELVSILAKNGGMEGMVHGQILDCFFEKTPLDLEQLKILHTNKTAKLIAAALQMGAVIVDLDKKMQNRLYDLGLELGLLFQIQDDIIDALWSEQEAGKTTQHDQDKNSFVNLLGLDTAITEADILAKKVQKDLRELDPDIQKSLQTLLQNYFYRHKHLKKDNDG